jgi:hypothetical protein
VTTPATLKEAFDAHAQAERILSLADTMHTVSADPVYELHPAGYRLSGRTAVSEYYRRTFHGYLDRIVDSQHRTTSFGDSYLVVEGVHTLRAHDEDLMCRSIAVLVVEDGLVSAERVYMDDAGWAVVAEALGDNFIDVPGVTRLSRTP